MQRAVPLPPGRLPEPRRGERAAAPPRGLPVSKCGRKCVGACVRASRQPIIHSSNHPHTRASHAVVPLFSHPTPRTSISGARSRARAGACGAWTPSPPAPSSPTTSARSCGRRTQRSADSGACVWFGSGVVQCWFVVWVWGGVLGAAAVVWLMWGRHGARIHTSIPTYVHHHTHGRKGDQYLFTLDMWATDVARWVRV